MAKEIRRGAKDGRTILMLVAIFLAIAALWGTVIVTPLKIFVVLLHEISHGVAAVATGGQVVRIEVDAQQGGICYTRGGNHFRLLAERLRPPSPAQ